MSTESMLSWQYSPTGSNCFEDDLNPVKDSKLPPMPVNAVLVKVLRASLNPADRKLLQIPLMARRIGLPVTPVTAFVGRVAQSLRDEYAVGDLVLGSLAIYPKHGALAEYTVAGPNDTLLKIDRGLESRIDEIAGIDPAAATAYFNLKNLKGGSKVFINGASGGTGTFGVQIAKAMGLQVVAACSTRNADLVKSLGADEVIDYKTTDVLAALQANVAKSGQLFARILQNVDSDTARLYLQSHTILEPSAEFLFVAMAPTLDCMLRVMKLIFLPAFLGGGRRKLALPTTPLLPELLEGPLQMVLDGKVRVVVDESFALENAKEAFQKLASGRATGKIIIKM